MSIAMWIWLLGIVAAAILLVAASQWQKITKVGADLAGGALVASFPFVFVSGLHPLLLVMAVIVQAWMLILPARLGFGRLEPPFLRTSTRNNAVVGIILILSIALLNMVQISSDMADLLVAIYLIACMCVLLISIGQVMQNTQRYKVGGGHVQPDKLPTVSVCIPARNEDHALEDCLRLVVASDYPKLEVLVLDDCSQDSTSQIIKTFAREGVRFVQGDQPAMGWLGKNQAMQTLATQAAGDYLLFADVDTHFSPQSISQVVNYALSERLEMVSILPENRLGLTPSTLFGTLEYFWRLVMPITRWRVPVSSKAWLINAASLRHLGGFESVSRKMVPEQSFASRLFARQTYRFLVSDGLGVTTAKRWDSQLETSIRLDYPQLRRQSLYTLAMCVFLVAVGLVPFVVSVWLLATANLPQLFWFFAPTALLAFFNYYLVLRRTLSKQRLFPTLFWPVVVLQEVALNIASMLMYEFSEVNWKGRNVCYPVVTLRPPAPPTWQPGRR